MTARRWVALILALAGCGAISTVAGAAAQRPQPVVVARDGLSTLTVHEEGDWLCLSISAGGTECDDPSEMLIEVSSDSDALKSYVAVAVTAAAQRVEVRRAGVLLGAAATLDGSAYTGRYAGTLRFALVSIPDSASSYGLRAYGYDSGGALVAADSDFPDELVFDRRRLLTGRAGSVRWSVGSSRRSRLTPALFDRAHETLSRCVDLEWMTSRGGRSDSRCVSDEPQDRLFASFDAQVQTELSCSPALRLLHGIADASTQRVTALLGDGTWRRARIAQLPGRAERAYALVISRTQAVRKLKLRSRSGQTRTIWLRWAPLAVACADKSNDLAGTGGSAAAFLFDSVEDIPRLTPPGPVTISPGDPAIRVADGPADTLCIAVNEVPFHALGCAIIGPIGDGVLSTADSTTEPRAVAVAVPANVALVRITAAGGRTIREVATVAAPGYAGRYAGLVRFATMKADPGEFLGPRGVHYLDASGRLLRRDESGMWISRKSSLLPARRIAGVAGAPSLWQSTRLYRDERAQRTERVDCVQITAGPPPGKDAYCTATRDAAAVLVDASCATRRLTVAVAATTGSRAFAETSAGRQPIALRNGAGLLTLSQRTSLRAVRIVRAGRTTRWRVNAPPGRSQCGWTASPNSTFG